MLLLHLTDSHHISTTHIIKSSLLNNEEIQEPFNNSSLYISFSTVIDTPCYKRGWVGKQVAVFTACLLKYHSSVKDTRDKYFNIISHSTSHALELTTTTIKNDSEVFSLVKHVLVPSQYISAVYVGLIK